MHALDGWLKAVRADDLVLVRTRVAGPWGTRWKNLAMLWCSSS